MLYIAAKINESNVVTDTIVLLKEDITDENGLLSDDLTTSLANKLRMTNGVWKWAGMHQEGTAELRKTQPGINDWWDPNTSKFYRNQPYPSWILDNNLNWHPPIPKPNNTTYWMWDEEKQIWELPKDPVDFDPEFVARGYE